MKILREGDIDTSLNGINIREFGAMFENCHEDLVRVVSIEE